MARKQKPIKIKRYKNSMGTGTNTVYKVKRTLPLVAGVLVLVLIGFLLGKPLLNMLSGEGSSSQPADVSSKQDVSSQLDTSSRTEGSSQQDVPSESSSSGNTSSDVGVIPPATAKTKVYYYADTALLATESGIDSVISAMKTAGATHLVFDVKNEDGNVMYTSSNQYASQIQSANPVDLKTLVAKLTQNNITPVARMYAFMDKMISTVERSTAVMYLGSESRWLDSSAALGGKAWANPASTAMQEYITSLTEEILSMGVKEIIYAGFHTPTGYSLDKRDFGASMDQVLAAMKSLYRTLEGKVSAKGGTCSMQVEYSAIMLEGDYSHYIVHPYQMGAKNIIVTAKGNDIDVPQAVAFLETATNGEEISSVTLWLTDGVNTDEAKSLGNYFTK